MDEKKRTVGRPKLYESSDQFMASVKEYINHCDSNNLIATDYGFIRWSGISHDSYYTYINKYSDDVKRTIDAWQADVAINGDPKKTAMAIFTLKNTQGWVDSPQVVIDNRQIKLDSNSDEIDKLLSKLGYLPIPGDS